MNLQKMPEWPVKQISKNKAYYFKDFVVIYWYDILLSSN